jgi:Holliday junction resolvase RusA-like endonuclease
MEGTRCGQHRAPKTDQLGGLIHSKANSFFAEKQRLLGQAITVTIDGRAVAKGRARFTRSGRAYTPSSTRQYETHGKWAAALAMGNRPPLTGPVRLSALIELRIPASWSKHRRAAAILGEIRPTSRPDVDNYLKSALDVICGIVIGDDAQIVELTAKKKFGVDPKLVLLIEPIEAFPSNREASQ